MNEWRTNSGIRNREEVKTAAWGEGITLHRCSRTDEKGLRENSKRQTLRHETLWLLIGGGVPGSQLRGETENPPWFSHRGVRGPRNLGANGKNKKKRLKLSLKVLGELREEGGIDKRPREA